MVMQWALQQNPRNPQLMEEEKAAHSTYAEALVKEQQIIKQKARVNWLQEGDRCTKFYYTQFAARKAHNTLNTVILPDGTNIEDQRQVQHYTIEYYKDLLNKESDQPIPPFSSSTRLDDGDNVKLCDLVTDEEILLKLKQMKADGNPGPDGFTVGFFQNCLEVIKEDLLAAIKEYGLAMGAVGDQAPLVKAECVDNEANLGRPMDLAQDLSIRDWIKPEILGLSPLGGLFLGMIHGLTSQSKNVVAWVKISWYGLTLLQKGLTREVTCPMCKRELETTAHLFLSCSFVSFIWTTMFKRMGIKKPRLLSMQLFVEWLESKFPVGVPRLVMHVAIVTTIKEIWIERCTRIFQKFDSHKFITFRRIGATVRESFQGKIVKEEMVDSVTNLAAAWSITFNPFVHSQLAIAWDPPQEGWIKSNSDGSLSSDRAGYGAILRNGKGDLLRAVAVQDAELSSIIELH
ncbi:hypothetical protein QJS10_CPA16g00638 [Acorus calamus]|uniref:Reverse transcriptase zinc-binding domain-containing protein n=1 Tax=Acorus calamus TaxID=4465 RepID=A0AAV9CZB8_ACOCL|nr:hypothetical protein QJS10_CPA16g00638 [Acorus calamus]